MCTTGKGFPMNNNSYFAIKLGDKKPLPVCGIEMQGYVIVKEHGLDPQLYCLGHDVFKDEEDARHALARLYMAEFKRLGMQAAIMHKTALEIDS